TIAHVERTLASERLVHWSFDSRDPDAFRDAREEFMAELAKGKLSEAAAFNAELVFAELIGNVVRYAPKWVDVTLDWSGPAPVLHVLDAGPGFRHLPKLPDNPLSETGRGLFIVARLADDFHVTKRPHGGSHARVVLSAAADGAGMILAARA
ncbi:MAG: ATP-binding protein, partial [Vulcanimicrobiaceae bacterium]